MGMGGEKIRWYKLVVPILFIICISLLLKLHSLNESSTKYLQLSQEMIQKDEHHSSLLVQNEKHYRPVHFQIIPFTPTKKALYIITPTYTRRTQLLDLTRVGQALQLASSKYNLLWLIVEDSDVKTELVTTFIEEVSLNVVHLNVREQRDNANLFKANTQRNKALDYIAALNEVTGDSVVYFADDDNAYDQRLFDEWWKVEKVGVVPVAYSGARRAELPVVNQDGKVVSFQAWYGPRKTFPIDMAGFAIAARYFLGESGVRAVPFAPSGTGEERLLRDCGFTLDDLEPLAERCTKVLVWHVKTTARVEQQFDKDSNVIKYVQKFRLL